MNFDPPVPREPVDFLRPGPEISLNQHCPPCGRTDARKICRGLKSSVGVLEVWGRESQIRCRPHLLTVVQT
ncbi:hypothetical protein TNCV_4886391 [Trichonephila clavipes]|uniref:Uncharacterized protein n=1 Tax=Trichonephila clavipes TaxID=2585209 RepID=A0A8X6V1H3_TRICX|nr:hypothetical protein TNCV_4886391 [Trichonephila clavipes]